MGRLTVLTWLVAGIARIASFCSVMQDLAPWSERWSSIHLNVRARRAAERNAFFWGGGVRKQLSTDQTALSSGLLLICWSHLLQQICRQWRSDARWNVRKSSLWYSICVSHVACERLQGKLITWYTWILSISESGTLHLGALALWSLLLKARTDQFPEAPCFWDNRQSGESQYS